MVLANGTQGWPLLLPTADGVHVLDGSPNYISKSIVAGMHHNEKVVQKYWYSIACCRIQASFLCHITCKTHLVTGTVEILRPASWRARLPTVPEAAARRLPRAHWRL